MNYTDFDEPITDDEDFLELMQLFLDDEEEPLVSKNIRKRPDYFNILSEKEFVERFRLTKEGALEVLEKISDHIARKTERNHAVTPITMLLVTLRFYATGSMLIVVGDFCGIDKSTASRIVAQRCFGIWKRRFPVLAFGMRVRLDRIQPIIVATAVLHNIARMRNIPDPEYNPDVEEAVHYLENVNNNNYAVGDEARIGPNNPKVFCYYHIHENTHALFLNSVNFWEIYYHKHKI
ncbi:hypothetical protein PPYR_01344 [Photinus pyralis]|uniref:Nuclease HARBI1 n=1 Tax=Photinus pyralis TaxID=7054 RepID=A0A5N4B499_PHOPY|nr:hypothetical protein PPYR_01344 [Photinus pyralis]